MASTHLLSSHRHVPSVGGPCWCCRRRDDGIGHYIHDRTRPLIIWTCRDHLPILEKAMTMPSKQFDIYEQHAIEGAGKKAGAYLDKLGKFDLSTLEKHEWLGLIKTVVDSFGDELQKELTQKDAPF